MALPPLEELRGAQRDGTTQEQRQRPELAAGAVGIDERTPAELIAFARRFASEVMWYDDDNRPAGWWASPEAGAIGLPGEPARGGATFFDGIGTAGTALVPELGYDEVARFLEDPAAFADLRYAPLRRPHMALLLTAVRLMGHGQRALNGLVDRHLDYHLREVLRLAPRPAEPDRAFVLFELGAGVDAAEVPRGLRLLAGRDERHRDRVYRLEEPLVVNRGKVARIASTFVDREITGLAAARRSITGTPEEQFLFLLSVALGDPRPGDALPPFGGKKVDLALLQAIGTFIGFSRTALFLELFELRAMLAYKARRSGEAAEWQKINKTLESAGKAKRGDPAWVLQTPKPGDFYGNLKLALNGNPDLSGLTEVETVDDLALHLDREDVRKAIETRLFMEVDRQFAPMMAAKRAIDADWKVINGYLELAGRRKRGKPDWKLKVTDQAAFADNLATALGAVDYAAAGPIGAGIATPDDYLAQLEKIEAWFFIPAEDIAQLVATYGSDDATPAGARRWREAYALLAVAHGRKVRAQEAAELKDVRLHPPAGRSGPDAELEAALDSLPPDLDSRMEALARYASADDVEFVRSLFAAPARRQPASSWDRVDTILAEARRRRLRLPEPVAQKEHWRALWAYDDARTATVTPDATAWRCFGGVPADAGMDQPPATIGWALASPVLALSTGRRRITLTLGFLADGGGPLLAPVDDHGDSPQKLPFVASLSGAKSWIGATAANFAEVDYTKVPGIAPVEAETKLMGLQVTLDLDETAPAVAPSPATSGFGGTAWPVLRLMLRPVWDAERGRFDTAYERFRKLKLARVHVAAAVGSFVADGAPGLWPLTAENDTGVVDAKKPFEPFGAAPATGSELALGHRDLLHKRLTKLRLSLEWLGGPASLATQYRHYDPRSFTAQLSMVDGAVRTTALEGSKALFAGDDARVPVRIDVATGDAARPDPVVEPLEPEVRGWRRYLTVRLNGTDFGHSSYAALVASKSITLANELRQNHAVAAIDYAVSPPYTPKLKRIALDFTAAQEIDVTRYDRARAIDRLFHVHPFGVAEADAGSDEGRRFLPSYDEEGALYVGLAGVEAPQSLSLLFAGAEGSGGEERAGLVRWSYLDGDAWTEFTEPPDDGTRGLTRRGIVRFVLPPVRTGTRMPAGFYWVRAAIADGAINACDMIDIHAQAGSARFEDDGAPPEHYLAPLPARTIRGIGDPAPGIARVVQPYAADGGRPAEAREAFLTRAAERLRHKNRALGLRDYELLVLERFAEVHKVKCLPASVFDDGPGTVRLVVIPDIRGKLQGNAFAPRAPAWLLDEIAAYLTPLAPPTARIAVGHPRFVQVRVRIGVRFRPGGDEAFDKRRLAEQLNRYLAPWAFDEGSDIAIGQRIDATSIVAFIDRLPFVDFVGVCRLFVSEDDGATFHPGEGGGESVEAQGEDAVLTPAERHEIDVIDDDLFEETQFTGIGYMKVELDFVVN